MTWDRFRIARETGTDPNDPRLIEMEEVFEIAETGMNIGLRGQQLYEYHQELKAARAARNPLRS